MSDQEQLLAGLISELSETVGRLRAELAQCGDLQIQHARAIAALAEVRAELTAEKEQQKMWHEHYARLLNASAAAIRASNAAPQGWRSRTPQMSTQMEELIAAARLVAAGYVANRIGGIDDCEDAPEGGNALGRLFDAVRALDNVEPDIHEEDPDTRPVLVLCETCQSEGRLLRQGPNVWDEIDTGECPDCGGTGRRFVASARASNAASRVGKIAPKEAILAQLDDKVDWALNYLKGVLSALPNDFGAKNAIEAIELLIEQNEEYAEELGTLRSNAAPPQADGDLDCFGYLRWTKTSCQRCGYEKADCTCPVGFAAPPQAVEEAHATECNFCGAMMLAPCPNEETARRYCGFGRNPPPHVEPSAAESEPERRIGVYVRRADQLRGLELARKTEAFEFINCPAAKRLAALVIGTFGEKG